MKSKAPVFFTLALTLILNACSPFVITSASGEQPTPETETIPVPSYQPVDVDQVLAEVGMGSPIPVLVTVTGTLPDTCAQLELVQQKQVGSNFEIAISTIPSNEEGCKQDPLPFKIVMPLNITNLPAGSYSVDVNGSRADFHVDTANTTSTQPAADSVITKIDIQVDDVKVETGVGSPLPVHAMVSLSLSNTCAQVGEMRLRREGTVFYVRLIADVAERADCLADPLTGPLPFWMEIPLNTVNLPEGPYEVNINGVTASFDPRATPVGPADLGNFESQLQAALTQRDAEGLRSLMGERFIVAHWQSEGESIPSEEAVTQILNNHLAEHNYLVFQEFQQIPAFDPERFVGPDVELAKAIYVFGWGLDGRGDALLFVSRRPDGSLFWQGLMVTPKGFAPPLGQACSEPVEVPVSDGRLSYNGISFSIDAALNYGIAARNCPAADWDPQGGTEAHPPYTEFFFPTYSRQNVDFQPSIRVYGLKGELKNYPYPLGAPDELKATLEQRPEPVTWFQHSPLHTRETYLDFRNGAGVRGLVQYMQDVFFYTNNGLIYEFNGLTQDGRHFIQVRYPVSAPFLMELNGFTLPPNNINPNAIAIPGWPSDYEQQRQVIEAYNNEALQHFEQISDEDVLPKLTLLDRLVQSMQVSQP